MSLRETAQADLVAIIGDAVGFGHAVTVTSPDGVAVSLVALTTDIGHTIDPETGVAVAGRSASAVFALRALAAAGLDAPRAIASATSRPWVVAFSDALGIEHKYKVKNALPDRHLGTVACILEAYRE